MNNRKKIIFGMIGALIIVLGVYIMFVITGRQIVKGYEHVNASLERSKSMYDSIDKAIKPFDDQKIQKEFPGCYPLYMAFCKKYDQLDSSISGIKTEVISAAGTHEAGALDRILLKEKHAEKLKAGLSEFFTLNNALDDSLKGSGHIKNYFDQGDQRFSWEELNFSNMPAAAVVTNLNKISLDITACRRNIWNAFEMKQAHVGH